MDRRNEVFPDIPLHGYTLETCLGHGTLTTVYRARKPKQDAHSTALITFLRLPASLPELTQLRFRERFWKYVERMKSLQHAHLLPIEDYGERNTTCYFLTEEISGTPLSTILSRKRRWSPQEALSIVTPLAEVFTYLHQQHLAGFFFDPAHVQIFDATQFTSLKLVLAALSLHKLFRRAGVEGEIRMSHPYEHLQSFSGHYLGQPHYLAPEIITGQEGTMRSDTYALGVLLFTLLSGTTPFVGTHYLETVKKQVESPLPSLRERIAGIPIRLEIVVNRALSRDPALRFPSPEALIVAYKKGLEEQEGTEQQALQLFQRVYTLTGTSTRSQATRATSGQHTLPISAVANEEFQVSVLKSKAIPSEAKASSQEGSTTSDGQQTENEKMQLHLSQMMQRLQQQQEAFQARSPQKSTPTPAFHNATTADWLN